MHNKRCDLHECSDINDKCPSQIKRGSKKLCTCIDEKQGCPFLARHPLGKTEPDDFLLP